MVSLAQDAFTEHGLRVTRRWLAQRPGSLVQALRRIRAGNFFLATACEHAAQGAWRRLDDGYRARLRALAHSRGLRGEAAQSWLDDGWAALVLPPHHKRWNTALGSYSGRGSLFSFLATFVWRRHVDRLRIASRQRSAVASVTDEPPAQRRDDPIARALDHDTAQQVRAAVAAGLDACTARERLTLVLKFRDGLPQREIATCLGVGPPRVSRLVEQGLRKLRGAMQAALERDAPGTWAHAVEAVRQELAIQDVSPRLPRAQAGAKTHEP